MRWCSVLSRDEDLVCATRDLANQARLQLGEDEPNLLVLFVSSHHAERYREISALLGSEFPSALLLGCSASSVIGAFEECEEECAIGVAAGVLPGVTFQPFHLDRAELPEESDAAAFWQGRLGLPADGQAGFVLLADPFSCDVDGLVAGLDAAFVDAVKVGGLASGGNSPGENALYLGSEVHRTGVVGVAMSGDLSIDVVVAQGCRPVGEPVFVTRSNENVLLELDGKPAFDVLTEVYKGLSPADQELAGQSLFVGIGLEGPDGTYGSGDFLVRNLVGIDRRNRTLVVGGMVTDGAVLQFHLREKFASARDLDERLARAADHGAARSAGGLLFSCLGRGRHLYGEPNHDSDALRRHLGPVPVAGFFGNGEIGPLAERTFVHGYTSVLALFRPAAVADPEAD